LDHLKDQIGPAKRNVVKFSRVIRGLLDTQTKNTRRYHNARMWAPKTNDKADAKTTAATTSTQAGQHGTSSKEIPSLGALDEDDEFEEFESQGELGDSNLGAYRR
jgi:hypothetical protein